MKKIFLPFICLSFIFIVINTVYAQPGALDPSFGVGGIVTTDIGAAADKGFSVVQQIDGKLVVAGLSNNGTDNDFALIRYNIDGSLDNTFGTAGITTNAVGLSNESGQCVILQPDAKILVAGFSSNGTNNDFALVRYNANGTLDNTFGVGGIVTTAVGGAVDQGQSVVLQPDGKIVVAGFSNNGVDLDFALVRYNTNGTIDNTFGVAGIVTTDFATSLDVGRSVTIQPDGKLILAGWSSNGANLDFALARYNTNGSLDITFDTDGKLTTALGSADDQGYSVVLQSDGKILVAGVSFNGFDMDFASVRYNTNGSLDVTYDTDGIVTTDFVGGNDLGYSVALQTDSKILMAGQSLNGADNDFAVTRYNSDGSLDITFDTDGRVTTDLGSTSDVGWSVAIQTDGRVVVTGSGNLSSYAFGTVRYKVCEMIDTSVIQNGDTLTSTALAIGYQWINCDSANAAIFGETNQNFIATNNGNYAVIVDMGGCTDTSACYNINTAGTFENSFAHSIQVYPNPTNGLLVISTGVSTVNASIKLLNVTGQTILIKQQLNGSILSMDLSQQVNGIYFLEITEGANVARIKVIKQ